MIKYEQEDEADRWLREHDPYYSSTKKNKTALERFPYDTLEMRHRRAAIEIPISNLSLKQALEIGAIVSEDGAVEL